MGASEIIGIVQIVIAIGAIGLALKAYQKVLEQINISNEQTQISIDQMDRLSKERLFELKLRLIMKIGDYRNDLKQLNKKLDDTSEQLFLLSMNMEEKYPEHSHNTINGLTTSWWKDLKLWMDSIIKQQSYLSVCFKNVRKTDDILFMEEVLETIEIDRMKYNSILNGLEYINEKINQMPLLFR